MTQYHDRLKLWNGETKTTASFTSLHMRFTNSRKNLYTTFKKYHAPKHQWIPSDFGCIATDHMKFTCRDEEFHTAPDRFPCHDVVFPSHDVSLRRASPLRVRHLGRSWQVHANRNCGNGALRAPTARPHNTRTTVVRNNCSTTPETSNALVDRRQQITDHLTSL